MFQFRVVVSLGVVAALALAGIALWSDWGDDFAGPNHAHPLPALNGVAKDGVFDNNLVLWREDSALLVADSIRPLVIEYENQQGELTGVLVVAGVIISRDYVMVSGAVPAGDSNSKIGAAYLLATPQDRSNVPELLGAITAIDEV